MTLPAGLFSAALWLAPFAVAAAAVYLLVVLLKEWRSGKLW